jgi:hypothetical protein
MAVVLMALNKEVLINNTLHSIHAIKGNEIVKRVQKAESKNSAFFLLTRCFVVIKY